MAELHNPLFEDEKEFLERQKLEYERALLGDVDHIKEKTQEVGKYAAIGVGLLGGIWLISKALRGRKDSDDDDEGYEEFEDDRLARKAQKKREKLERKQGKNGSRASYVSNPAIHGSDYQATDDDHGFGGGHQFDRGQQQPSTAARADLAPDVYHASAENDPFPPLTYDEERRLPVQSFKGNRQNSEKQASLVATMFHTFLQSDAGKMMTAQITAVLMAYVAKKVGEYLPVNKNSDLADDQAATQTEQEPETKDIDFTYHHDADAPQQSL